MSEELFEDNIDEFDLNFDLNLGEAPEGDYGIITFNEWLDWYSSDNNKLHEPQFKIQSLQLDKLNSLALQFLQYPTGLKNGKVLSTISVNVATFDDVMLGIDKLLENSEVFLYNICYNLAFIDKSGKVVTPEFYKVEFCSLKLDIDN